MLGIHLDKENSHLYGSQLGKICLEHNHFRFAVVSVIRGSEKIVPFSEFEFKRGDIVYFVIKKEDVENLLELTEKPIIETHRVMIIGGSKIGRTLAKELPSQSINVRLIESDRPKAGKISHDIDESMIIYGDGTDIEFLKSENIQDVDSVITVTENEKTNLISGLLAKHLGAKQSIIHVSTSEYIPTIKEIGSGAVISKNLSTVNAILKELYSDITDVPVMTFDEIEIDVIELQPEKGSLITQKSLKELNLPKDCVIGMINHHGKIRIAHGTSILTEEDIALVFSKSKVIEQIKKMFIL
jgi:trk system potassium uptake protein TrkA